MLMAGGDQVDISPRLDLLTTYSDTDHIKSGSCSSFEIHFNSVHCLPGQTKHQTQLFVSVPQGACFCTPGCLLHCILSLSVLFDTISGCLSYVTISLWRFLRRYRKTGSQVVLPIFCVLSAIHGPLTQLPTHARLSWRGHTITGNRSPTQVHR